MGWVVTLRDSRWKRTWVDGKRGTGWRKLIPEGVEGVSRANKFRQIILPALYTVAHEVKLPVFSTLRPPRDLLPFVPTFVNLTTMVSLVIATEIHTTGRMETLQFLHPLRSFYKVVFLFPPCASWFPIFSICLVLSLSFSLFICLCVSFRFFFYWRRFTASA